MSARIIDLSEHFRRVKKLKRKAAFDTLAKTLESTGQPYVVFIYAVGSDGLCANVLVQENIDMVGFMARCKRRVDDIYDHLLDGGDIRDTGGDDAA